MEDIKSLLCHIKTRETSEGAVNAFRFKKYWNRNELCDAAYPSLPHADGGRSMPPAPGHQKNGPIGKDDQLLSMSPSRSVGEAADHRRSEIPGVSCSWQSQPPRLYPVVATPHNQNTIITQDEMSRLADLGIPTAIPINGPQDGQPIYYMPQTQPGFVVPQNIDPNLLK